MDQVFYGFAIVLFAACILIALLRQQHVRLDFTAPTARAFVGELFNALG